MAVRIAWAYSAGGHLVHVTQVQSGLACKCTCTACHSALEAINPDGGGVMPPHFRHYELPEEGACSLRTAFLVIRDVLSDIETLAVPAFRGGMTKRPGETLTITDVQFTSEHEAILTTDDDRRLLVRLVTAMPPAARDLPDDPELAVLDIQVDDPFLASLDRKAAEASIRKGHLLAHWRRHWMKAANSVSEAMEQNAAALQQRRRAVTTDQSELRWALTQPDASQAAKIVKRYRGLWAQTDWEGLARDAVNAWPQPIDVDAFVFDLCARYGISSGNTTVAINFLRAARILKY